MRTESLRQTFKKWQSAILLSLVLALSVASANTQASNQRQSIPPQFTLEAEGPGVKLYGDNSDTNFVQIVSLNQGASVHLLHGAIGDPGIGQGPFGGNNPWFARQTLSAAWNGFSGTNENAFCLTNGQFFSTNDNPTPLAFSLKKGGVIVSDGYAAGGPGEEFPGQKLMLELWGGKANIVELTRDNLYNSDAPNIIAGLSEDADKGVFNPNLRTFVGIDDANGDGAYEIVLILNSKGATQGNAADTLRAFGADKVIMLDGGGSTQLICEGVPYISSSRMIPQTLAVSAAPVVSGAVDVVLIIDSSGSMDSNDPNDKRLDAGKAYLTASLAGDYVGVVDFDDSVRLASQLQRLPENKDSLIAAINSIDSSGYTDIGGGVQAACNELQSPRSTSPVKAAILLTDGRNEPDPYGGQHSCFIDHGWPIYAFGFGNADDDLLAQIAASTGGDYKRLPTSNLVCEFQAVRTKIGGGQPSACTAHLIDPNELIQFPVQLLEQILKATFSLSWMGSDVELSLVSPSGRVIDRDTTAPDVEHDLGATYESYGITNPEPGQWQVKLFGADVPAGGEEVVFNYATIGEPIVATSLYLPAILFNPAPPPQPLLNGDFEAGATNWTETSSHGWRIIVNSNEVDDLPTHSGIWIAWLGGDDNEISYIEQTVTVPTDRPFLTYYHAIASEDACGYDFGGVLINGEVIDVYDLCADNNSSNWERHVVNLSAFAGQTVALQIRSETDGSLNSNLLVDDVAFSDVAAARARVTPVPFNWPTAVSADRPTGLSLDEMPSRLLGPRR